MKKITIFLFISCLLTGCHNPVEKMQNDTMRAEGKALVDATNQNNALARKKAMRVGPLPHTVETSLMPQNETVASGASAPAAFDVAVNDMSVNDFFLYLSDMTTINIIVSPEITRQTITLSLRHVTLENILDAVKDKYAISYYRTPYGYSVTPRGMITHFFHINYLNTESKSFTTVDVNNSSLGSSTGGAVTASPDSSSSSGEMVSKNTTQYDNASFWQEVRATVESFLGKGEKRNVTINKNDGIVIVTAYPDKMAKISAYLAELNAGLNQEILIEAKFLELTLSADYQTGINWSQLGLNVSSDTGTVQVSQPFSFTDINTVVKLLNKQGQITVLSNPRVTALNNQPALIKVGSDSYYVTGVNSGTTPIGQTATLTSNVQLSPFFSGISLSVMPHILLNKKIQLHVHPIIDIVSEQKKVINLGENQTMVLPLATTTSREADATVQVEDSQVIVLGGLMQSATSVDKQTLAPVDATGFFPNHNDTGDTTELVILLKVSIVNNNSDIWNENIKAARDEFASLAVDKR